MQRQTIRYFSIGIAFLLAFAALNFAPRLFAPLDHTLSDWRIRWSWEVPGSKSKFNERERRVVIIDIDERSLKEQGPWPWSRDKVSSLIETLLDHYGVSGVALDIVFPEVKERETALLNQLHRPEITGAVVYDLMDRHQPELSKGLPAFPALSMPVDFPTITGVPVTSNHPALMPGRIGHITPLFDSDGSIRRLPPFACHRIKSAECRPLLGVSAFMGLLSHPQVEVKRGVGLFSPDWAMVIKEGKDAELVSVPIGIDGTITVPYRHQQQDWLSIAATDILNRKAQKQDLSGSLVLVGATALGMSDVVFTPVSPVASGLEPHAEVMVALLDNSFLVVPQYGLWLDAMLVLPLLVLLLWSIKRMGSPMRRAILFPGWLALSWAYLAACVMAAYVLLDLLLPLTPLALFPLFTVLFIVSIELYVSTREKNGISGLLAAYLPWQVAQKLTETNQMGKSMDISVDASRRKITVMFADVRGFTGIVEGHKPEVVAKLMHRVFSEMAASVVAHHGTIDKFIGDAVMAFWNAPEDDPLHALHALAAAQDMLRRVHLLGDFCIELGVPQVNIGIGIETGFALIGNFGSEHRRTYTALGETVVLASRIEGLTAQYQRSILIGEECAKTLNLEGLEPLGEVQVRGRQRAIALYTPKSAPQFIA